VGAHVVTQDLAWPILPPVNVPEPSRHKGPWDQEAHVNRYKRQHRDLLNAAAKLLGDQGIGRTSVSAIVAKARVSKRTFYEHFESREDCFVELLKRITTAVARDLIRTAEEMRGDSSLEVVAAMLTIEISTFRSGEHMVSALFDVSRSGSSQKLVDEDVRSQQLLGQVFAVAAWRLGSPLSTEQVRLTAQTLNYALGVQMRSSAPGILDVSSLTVVWCQALGLTP
jgi:AcrR family transcriptional regulator